MPYLLVDGYVLTMDAQRRAHRNGFVLTDGAGRIAAVGPMAECPEAPGAERIDCTGRMILPGLIDALHVHWTHLFPGMRLPVSFAARLDQTAHLSAARLAASALIGGGVTTALVEMPPRMSAGLVSEVLAVFRKAGVTAIAAVEDSIAPAVDSAAVIVTANVIALAEGRATEATIRSAVETARRLGRRMLLRIQPEGVSREAMLAAQRQLGRSTVYHLMEMGLLDEGSLLVCPEDLDDLDRALILESGCYLIGLPISDSLRGAGSTAFSTLARAGVPCTLGSEGPGTGWTCDMIEQIKAAVMTQNTQLLDPMAMSTERALEMATINAAEALGLGGEIGSIEPGKRADIAVFDNSGPHQQVQAKPVSAFITTTRATEARLVLSAGARPATPEPGQIAASIIARRSALATTEGRGTAQ